MTSADRDGKNARSSVSAAIRIVPLTFSPRCFSRSCLLSLVRYADAEGADGKLPIGVNFVLDEFPNLGVINDFKKKISTVRSRNIGISVIFQNIAQLKNRYPNDEYLEILGNCDTQIALGCTDEVTARFISQSYRRGND